MKYLKLFGSMVLFLISTAPRPATAWPVTFGSEFEFTSKELVEHGGSSSSDMIKAEGLERRVAAEFLAAVIARCPDCAEETVPGKWGAEKRISFDGWWFQISYDPSCVEVLTKPSTLAELRVLAPKINHVLFGAALEDVKLFADYETGAGHFNFGANSAFNSDTNLFFKYFTDFSNHPELAFGAWGWDNTNAPAMVSLQQNQKDAFTRLLSDVRKRKVTNIAEGARRIQQEIYTWTPDDSPHAAYHYQAVGLKKLNKPTFPQVDAPFEIRAMFPQSSEDEFIRIGEIIERRIQYLKKQDGQLAYFKIQVPDGGFDYQQIVDVYYKYLTEMGLDWDKYKFTMYPAMQEHEPGDFVKGNVHWIPSYAKSLLSFAPYLQTSGWVREKVFQAFTDSRGSKTITARKTLSKLIDSIDPQAVYATNSYGIVYRILNDPSWAKNPDRAALLEQVKNRMSQETSQICEEALVPRTP
jgi:hypothetical protein